MTEPFEEDEPIDGVVFDLDGTLVDSLYEIKDACDKVIYNIGCYPPFPLETYSQLAGNGNKLLLARALTAARLRDGNCADPIRTVLEELSYDMDSNELVDAVRQKVALDSAAAASGAAGVKVFPGAREVLDALTACGKKVAVLSNKTHAETVAIVAVKFPGVPFSRVYGAREGTPLKPEGQLLIDLANEMGVDVDRIVMVGDTDVDVMTARNAGVRSIGVSWGFRDAKELESTGASRIAHTFADVRTAFGI